MSMQKIKNITVKSKFGLTLSVFLTSLVAPLLIVSHVYAATNVVTNGGAESHSTAGWTASGSWDYGWNTPHAGSYSFDSSHILGTLSQTVDLLANGYTQNQLDTQQPDITFSNWMATRGDQGGQYYLLYKLIGTDGSTVKASFNFGSSGSLLQLSSGTNWFQQSHTFSSYGTGVRYVYMELGGRDQSNWAGNYGTDFDDASIAVDPSAPTAPSSLGGNSIVSGGYTANQPAFSFALSDADSGDQVGYQIQIDDTSDFSSPVVNYASTFATQGSASFTVGQAAGSGYYWAGSSGQTLPEGTYYWRVRTFDDGWRSSSYTTANGGAVAFRVDNTAPTTPGVPTTTSPINSATPTWTWTASTDGGAGLDATPYNVQWSQSPTFASGVSSAAVTSNSYAPTLTEGTWYMRVSASDAVGHNSSYSPAGTVVVDLTPPVLTLSGDATLNLVVGDSFTDPGATATDNLSGDLTSAIVKTGTVNTSTVGSYVLSYNVTDAAGNTSSKTRTLNVTAKPIVVVDTTTDMPADVPQTIQPELATILLNDFADFLTGEGKSLNLQPDAKVYFNVTQPATGQVEKHTITVKSVQGDAVLITVSSKPFDVMFHIGETKDIDVDKDGINDVRITLTGVSDGVAQVVVKQLAQTNATDTAKKPQIPTVQAPRSNTNKYMVISIAMIVFVIGVVAVLRRKKH